MNKVKAVCDAFDIGFENIADVPKITIIGKDRVYVENFLALEEYKSDNIKLKCKNLIIEILGQNFKIKNIREACIEIDGSITGARLI